MPSEVRRAPIRVAFLRIDRYACTNVSTAPSRWSRALVWVLPGALHSRRLGSQCSPASSVGSLKLATGPRSRGEGRILVDGGLSGPKTASMAESPSSLASAAKSKPSFDSARIICDHQLKSPELRPPARVTTLSADAPASSAVHPSGGKGPPVLRLWRGRLDRANTRCFHSRSGRRRGRFLRPFRVWTSSGRCPRSVETLFWARMPPGKRSLAPKWKRKALELPIFREPDTNGTSSTRPLRASTWIRYLKRLGQKAGFQYPFTQYGAKMKQRLFYIESTPSRSVLGRISRHSALVSSQGSEPVRVGLR